MQFFRKHWYDVGGILAVALAAYVWIFFHKFSAYQFLMWLNLISLLMHQVEEYRWPGTFPGTMNIALGKSADPLRYPLNTNTALLINLSGWIIYLLAAIFAEKAVWIGVIAIMISAGNFIAHTVLFNVKGHTVYNAGMITSWILFLPCVIIFIQLLTSQHLAGTNHILAGVVLGILVNVLIPVVIFRTANRNSRFSFRLRQMGVAK